MKKFLLYERFTAESDGLLFTAVVGANRNQEMPVISVLLAALRDTTSTV